MDAEPVYSSMMTYTPPMEEESSGTSWGTIIAIILSIIAIVIVIVLLIFGGRGSNGSNGTLRVVNYSQNGTIVGEGNTAIVVSSGTTSITIDTPTNPTGKTFYVDNTANNSAVSVSTSNSTLTPANVTISSGSSAQFLWIDANTLHALNLTYTT